MEDADRFLKRLEFTVVRRLDGLLQGNYPGVFYGRGLDLAEVREYQYGDEARWIDWNVTARMNHVFVRQFVEERELTAWLLLDTSPSVDFGTATRVKRDLAVGFAGVASYLLTRHGNKIGLMAFSTRVDRVVPPRSGRRHAVRIVHTLHQVGREERPGRTNLSAVLQEAAHVMRRRSLLFVVSDFLADPGWERPLRLLAQRHEVIAVRIEDPRERDLPDVGMLCLEDPETGEQIWVDTANRRLRDRYQQAAEAQRQRVDQELRRAGADLLDLSTAESMVRPLVQFITTRKRRRPWISPGR